MLKGMISWSPWPAKFSFFPLLLRGISWMLVLGEAVMLSTLRSLFPEAGHRKRRPRKPQILTGLYYDILWYIMIYYGYSIIQLFIVHYVLFPTCQVRVSGSSQRCNFSPPAYCSASSGCSWAHLDPKTCQIECQKVCQNRCQIECSEYM